MGSIRKGAAARTALVALLLGLACGGTFAADPAPPADANLYQMPAGDNVDALMTFIQRIIAFEPSSEQEMKDYNAQAGPAIQAAAEKVLKLEKDPRSAAARQAQRLLLNLQINDIEQLGPARQRALYESVLKMLGAGEMTQGDIQLARMLASNLEHGGNPALAAEADAAFAKALSGSDNEHFRELAKKFAGAHRRLTLIGKPLELRGETIDGKPLDWAKYRGKVVLVDFWGTWCEPCREEIPNIKRNYEKYHARGFDVVGVSVNDDRETLVEFLNQQKLPWANVQNESGDPDKPTMTDYYGISSFPTTFLVDRQGNVVSLAARGPRLGEQIEKALAAAKAAGSR